MHGKYTTVLIITQDTGLLSSEGPRSPVLSIGTDTCSSARCALFRFRLDFLLSFASAVLA